MARKPDRDINKAAFDLVQQTTKPKNEHAVALGRMGGLKGGPARAHRLSKSRRREIARQAALSRWRRPRRNPT